MKTEDQISKVRHSLAHILAMAVKEMYPQTKLAIGPPVENGFYYDFQFPEGVKLSAEDLKKIEKRMTELSAKQLDFNKKNISEEEAKSLFQNEPYKLEILEALVADGNNISIYEAGSFVDLCDGPHVKNTREIPFKAFKLDRLAGAYWRGDENNTMLTRLYGLAFLSEKELLDYLKFQEEAKERDHRKLGAELDLFSFSDIVGAGLPLFSPKGTIIRTELQNALLEISRKYDMLPVTIPHIGKIDLYKISGHAEKFEEELFVVKSHYNQEFVMKPVNCPHHTQIYASRPRSYRELPLRYMESTMQYRDEKPGEIGGLTRVRAITCDDGHIFCTVDQIKEEVKNIARIIEEFYATLGMFGNHWVSLSVRDPNNTDKYIGSEEEWKKSEEMLTEISTELNLQARRIEGEAAIYGPKLDYMFRDSLGRERQLATIQVDFAMPKRFNLLYKDSDGKDKHPVMIHRAILGSFERFLAILIEHFAGAFPLWLSPVQITILPVSEKHNKASREIFLRLKKENIRVSIDDSDEGLGKKVRNAKKQKTPYLLIVGDEEIKTQKVKLEKRGSKDSRLLSLEDLIQKLKQEINERILN